MLKGTVVGRVLLNNEEFYLEIGCQNFPKLWVKRSNLVSRDKSIGYNFNIMWEECERMNEDFKSFGETAKHKKEAYLKGAQGSTNNSQELFVSVTDAIKNRKVRR